MLYILAGTINQLGFKISNRSVLTEFIKKTIRTKVGPDGKVSRSPSR
jgi:hypothetical protein